MNMLAASGSDGVTNYRGRFATQSRSCTTPKPLFGRFEGSKPCGGCSLSSSGRSSSAAGRRRADPPKLFQDTTHAKIRPYRPEPYHDSSKCRATWRTKDTLHARFHESCHKRGIHLGFQAPI